MMIMASAGDLIVLYLGLELMALSTYILAGFIQHEAPIFLQGLSSMTSNRTRRP
jgi:formate hydrogenlyase subunit 3/multisubunit Na+/H+ antiporter MnhD subunit